ncbi:MAG: purine nucleoside permease [Saprospiraceae bacterium]
MRIALPIVFYMILLLAVTACQSPTAPAALAKIPIKVVIVSMFEAGNDTGDRPGEFQFWVERLPLPASFPFPQGYRQLRYNPDLQVLGIMTGIGNTKSAASIMALGLDDRFDLSKAYWLVAGIAGIDPADAPTASAAWAEWLVDGDLSHEIDAREIPADWKTGYFPLRQTEPYAQPINPNNEGVVAQLNAGLVDWAYQLTKDIELPDNEDIKAMREQYVGYPAATMKPLVLKGDQLAGSTYWHGKLLTEWANDWVAYWSEGKGNFVTSAMEEMGTYHALDRLHQSGLVDKNRLLVLRTASNFSMQWPGITAQQSLAGEKLTGKGYSAYIPALESAYKVGQPVVMTLVEGWDVYAAQLPGQE